MNLGRYEEAHQTLTGLLPELRILRDMVRFLQGEALFGLKKYQLAAQHFRSAARSKKSRWIDRAWLRRAQAFQAAGQFKKAVEEFEHVLRIHRHHPQKPDVKFNLANSIA